VHTFAQIQWRLKKGRHSAPYLTMPDGGGFGSIRKPLQGCCAAARRLPDDYPGRAVDVIHDGLFPDIFCGEAYAYIQ
jgi:hypothetical protein